MLLYTSNKPFTLCVLWAWGRHARSVQGNIRYCMFIDKDTFFYIQKKMAKKLNNAEFSYVCDSKGFREELFSSWLKRFILAWHNSSDGL